jgi:hypothetical protein
MVSDEIQTHPPFNRRVKCQRANENNERRTDEQQRLCS